jgi:hypothetical protein
MGGNGASGGKLTKSGLPRLGKKKASQEVLAVFACLLGCAWGIGIDEVVEGGFEQIFLED